LQSTACPFGLFFSQDDSDGIDRPHIFHGENGFYPLKTSFNLVEETDCFKDVTDEKGVYSFIEKFKNFNTLRK